ncbi:MAG TPA: GTPase HflX [Treponemataceae bacterium]|nr:GTPase HflX [Treponemataceae bacterium]
MIDLEGESNKPILALLVGKTDDKAMTDADCVRELSSLAETAGLTVAGTVVLRRFEPAPKFGMGTGKAAEIAALAKELEAEQIVFDFEISPTQQRNWDELSGITCLDRQELIIRIFAGRARTREAVLQVELARLEYSLPRLAHTYTALSRQRGGRYGTKGSGETQLELDRRTVLDRISLIKKDLVVVRRDRATQRKRRERVPVPSCAIVGYTNVGKSSLLNALTGAGVLSEDKLFATLDPTTRRFNLPTGRPILLTDTVGFIRNLPHGLIDAFHATLEEAAFADAILLVLDASDPEIAMQLNTTREVLGEVGAGDRPVMLVLNKMDLVDDFTRARLVSEYSDAVPISAQTKEGFEEFVKRIDILLSGDERRYLLPPSRSDLVAFAHREGSVLEVRYLDDAIELRARTSGKLAVALEEFLAHD